MQIRFMIHHQKHVRQDLLLLLKIIQMQMQIQMQINNIILIYY
jgi:hypothetical protein